MRIRDGKEILVSAEEALIDKQVKIFAFSYFFKKIQFLGDIVLLFCSVVSSLSSFYATLARILLGRVLHKSFKNIR